MFKKIPFIFLFILFVFQISFGQESNYKLLIFEGSDWCANCIRFDKNVNSNESFATFVSEKNITVEHIDFPQRKTLDENTKKYNAEIAEKYGFKGSFPTILLVDTSTNVYEELRYTNQTPNQFIDLIKSKISKTR